MTCLYLYLYLQRGVTLPSALTASISEGHDIVAWKAGVNSLALRPAGRLDGGTIKARRRKRRPTVLIVTPAKHHGPQTGEYADRIPVRLGGCGSPTLAGMGRRVSSEMVRASEAVS